MYYYVVTNVIKLRWETKQRVMHIYRVNQSNFPIKKNKYMNKLISKYLFSWSVYEISLSRGRHNIHSKINLAFCCYHKLQAAPKPVTGVFQSHTLPYIELPLIFGNQWAIGNIGKSHIHGKAHNNKDSLVAEVKQQFCIRESALINKTCSRFIYSSFPTFI